MKLEILNTNKGQHVDQQRTICEAHRTIADLLVVRLSDRPEVIAEIMPHVNRAYLLGIKLVHALIERKIALPRWEANNVEQAAFLRRERTRLLRDLSAYERQESD